MYSVALVSLSLASEDCGHAQAQTATYTDRELQCSAFYVMTVPRSETVHLGVSCVQGSS